MANVRAGGSGQHFEVGRGNNKNYRMHDGGGGYNRSNSGRGGGFTHRNLNNTISGQFHSQVNFQHNSERASSLPKQFISQSSVAQHLTDDGGHFWINNSTAALCITQYFLNNIVLVKIKDGRCYEGILQGCVSQSELCISHVVELSAKPNGLERLVNHPASKPMCIPMADIVFMKAKAVAEDEVVLACNGVSNLSSKVAVKDSFTDEGIRNRAVTTTDGNHLSDCGLQEFDLETDVNGVVVEDMPLELLGGGESSWSVESMFLAPSNRLIGDTNASDFDATFETKYSSVQINVTDDFEKRLKRAEQLSREITANNPSAAHLELENHEDEEARFSAVQCTDRFVERPVGTSVNPRAGSVPPMRLPPLSQGFFRLAPSGKVAESLPKSVENLKMSSVQQSSAAAKENRSFYSKRQHKVRTNHPIVEDASVAVSFGTPETLSISPTFTNSSLNSENETPLSNLNPDAFEFKPRTKNNPAVAVSIPDLVHNRQASPVIHLQQAYGNVMSVPQKLLHNPMHATPQHVMIIPHHLNGTPHQAVVHGQPTHTAFTAPALGSIALYPQMIPYAPSHGAHGVFAQGVPHSPVFIIPMHHSQQHHLHSVPQIASVAVQHPVSSANVVIHSSGNNVGSNGSHKASFATLHQQPVVVNSGVNGSVATPHQSLAQQMMVTGPPIMMSAQPAQYYQYQAQQLLRHPSQLQQHAHDPTSSHIFYEHQQHQQLDALQRQQQMNCHGQIPPAGLVGGSSSGSIIQQLHVAPSPPITAPQGVIFPVGAVLSQHNTPQLQWNAIAAHQTQWNNVPSHCCPPAQYQASHQQQQSFVNVMASSTVHQQHYLHPAVPAALPLPSYNIFNGNIAHQNVEFQAAEQTALHPGHSG